MRKMLNLYFMPFMALYIIFFDEICSCTQILTGSLDSSSISHILAILLAGTVYSLLFYDFVEGKLNKKNILALFFLLLITSLYFVTHLFFSGERPKYFSYFLVLLAESIPAAYIGMRLARSFNINLINQILPYFVIPISLLIGTIGIRYAEIGERVNNDDSGLNYQTLSYYMAFSFSYASYYVFLKKEEHGIIKKIIRVLMMLIMFYCAIICLVSGGRGAFVFIIANSIFLIYNYYKISKKHHFRAILILSIVSFLTVWLVNFFNVMESAGMLRVMNRLTEDDHRMSLYNAAFTAFLNSPLWGNGLGSVWWTVGFYCHNMILDFLSESGVLGTGLVLTIIINALIKLYKYNKIDKIFLFLLIVLLGALIRNMFSSYWVSAIKIFFICSLMYCSPMVRNNNNDYIRR